MQLTWHIGDVVAKMRDALGISQHQLAKAAGVGPSTVVRLEGAGNSESATLEKVAKALGVSVAELYTAIPKSAYVVIHEERQTRTVGYKR